MLLLCAAELHFCDHGPLTAQYLLVVDTLNFCFWPDGEFEYEHLAGGLKVKIMLPAWVKPALQHQQSALSKFAQLRLPVSMPVSLLACTKSASCLHSAVQVSLGHLQYANLPSIVNRLIRDVSCCTFVATPSTFGMQQFLHRLQQEFLLSALACRLSEPNMLTAFGLTCHA
jgi:hypothetical protein